MAQDMIPPGECSMCTWEKGEIHCCFQMVATSHTVSARQTLLSPQRPVQGSLCYTTAVSHVGSCAWSLEIKGKKPVNLTPPSSPISCLLPKATEQRGSRRTLAPSRDRRRQTKSRDRKDWLLASWGLTKAFPLMCMDPQQVSVILKTHPREIIHPLSETFFD